MTSLRAVIRQPAFFVLLGGAFFTLISLPFVVLEPPLDLFAPSLFAYLFAVWGALVALLLLVAVRLGRERSPADPGEEEGSDGA